MEETKIIITVTCKVPLTSTDMRYLENDVTRRLQATLVQKLASVEFKEEKNGHH